QAARNIDEGAVRLAHAKHAHARGRARSVAFHHQAGARRRLRQLGCIFLSVEESEIVQSGTIERGNPGDAAFRIGTGTKRRPGQCGDLTNGQSAPTAEKKRLGHALAAVQSTRSEFRPAAEAELLYTIVGLFR